MNREIAENAIKDFNYFVDGKMEERITSGQQVSDTLADIQDFVKSIEPEWLEKHKDILPEIESAADEEFFDLCAYVMINNSGAMPSFIAQGLRKRGTASEKFLTQYLELPILEMDVNSQCLTKEQLYQTDMINSAIYLAGELESDTMYQRIGQLFRQCITANEMFLEKMVSALSHKSALPVVKELLADQELAVIKIADVMQMVCNIGEKSDELFKLMKQGFKLLIKDPQTEIVGAMLMYDYGDTRIIPAMRKLAKDKIEVAGIVTKDNTPIYILLSMIHKLGGNTSELTGGRDLFN